MKIKLDIKTLGEDGYHIFCKVTVNGLTCRALIDTAASKTDIGKKLAGKLKLTEFSNHKDNQMTGIQPGEMDVSFVNLESIKFGKLTFKDTIAGLIDLTHVSKQYKSINVKPFQLIIGGDILYKGQAIIDYKNKILKLTKP